MKPIKARVAINDARVSSVTPADMTVISLDGKDYFHPSLYILPSFVESHAHIFGQGEKLILPDISKASSLEEIIDIALSHTKRRGDWIFLRGWDETRWEKTYKRPIDLLNSAFPDTPIALVRIDGHAMYVNSEAVLRAGIDVKESVDGGKFLMDDNSDFTGIAIDNAMNFFYDAIPDFDFKEVSEIILLSINDFLEKGITEVHDMDVHLQFIENFIHLAKTNQLALRVRSYIRAFDGEYKEKYPKPFTVGNLDVCGLKFYADGALGSRGALLLGKYADDSSSDGLQLISNEKLMQEARLGCKAGWEIATHAIGDAAVRNVLDVYEKLRNEGFDNVLRIEHSQIVSAEDIERFKKLRVIPSVQPIHCTSDSSMAADRLGERLSSAYPWKSFVDQDIYMIAGSDAPIESNSVLKGIDAFVNRVPSRPTPEWLYGEKISIDSALKSYILHPRYLQGRYRDSEEKKMIEHNSSFILLDNDFENTDTESILGTRILATFSDGILVYSPKESAAS